MILFVFLRSDHHSGHQQYTPLRGPLSLLPPHSNTASAEHVKSSPVDFQLYSQYTDKPSLTRILPTKSIKYLLLCEIHLYIHEIERKLLSIINYL